MSPVPQYFFLFKKVYKLIKLKRKTIKLRRIHAVDSVLTKKKMFNGD